VQQVNRECTEGMTGSAVRGIPMLLVGRPGYPSVGR